MRLLRIWTVFVIGIVIAMLGSALHAQKNETVSDDDMKIIAFEDLRYPLAARLAHTEGVVVIRLKLDDDGNISETHAISGAKGLIPDCLANAKKWRFHPNANKTAIIVYYFRIEGLCQGYGSSQFIFHPPNLAIITSCDAVVEP